MISAPEARAYWANPPAENQPASYLMNRQARSEWVADRVEALVEKDARVLEIGCNAGPNLAALHARGFTALEGVEINLQAVLLLRQTFPELDGVPLHAEPLERFTAVMGDYDLVFTVAVLEHIHPDGDHVFEQIAARTRWLLTVEDEHGQSPRHFPRDYNTVFTGLGMTETDSYKLLDTIGLDQNFAARVFTWDTP